MHPCGNLEYLTERRDAEVDLHKERSPTLEKATGHGQLE
jgi:hypothetical protein